MGSQWIDPAGIKVAVREHYGKVAEASNAEDVAGCYGGTGDGAH